MDWNKLQHTLFALDPSDPREDLRKLAESASGMPQENAPITESLVQESVEVQEGTMPVEGNYSLSDFAALAGVTLTEAQKTGSAGQLKGKDAIKKNPAGTTKNPTRDKLVGENDLDEIGARDALKRGWDNYNTPGAVGIENPLKKLVDPSSPKAAPTKKSLDSKSQSKTKPGDWKSFLQQHTSSLQKIAADPMKRKQFDQFMSKMSEDTNEQEIDEILPALGAMAVRAVGGAVANKAVDKLTASKNKKKKPIKSKIDPTTESIKEMLYRKLNNKK